MLHENTDGHVIERLAMHAATGAITGLTVSDRIVAMAVAICASLAVGITMELLRPWLTRRESARTRRQVEASQTAENGQPR